MTFQSLAAILTASFLSAVPVMAQDTTRDLGGGFRTDSDMPDAHSIDCEADVVSLRGHGGVVRALTDQVEPKLGHVTAIVVSKSIPILVCGKDVLLVITLDRESQVYLHTAEATIIYGN